MTRVARVELLVLIAAGSVGAGVHAAIAPEHLREWAPLGASFIAVAALLGVAAVALAVRPDDARFLGLLAALLGSVAAAYLATRLTAIPLLDPEREPFDGLGIGTSAIEALGLLVAVHIHPPWTRRSTALSSGGKR